MFIKFCQKLDYTCLDAYAMFSKLFLHNLAQMKSESPFGQLKAVRHKLGRHTSRTQIFSDNGLNRTVTNLYILGQLTNGDSTISLHSCMHICNVVISSAGCRSPKRFVVIDIFSAFFETSEPLVLLGVAHSFHPIHFLQLCIDP